MTRLLILAMVTMVVALFVAGCGGFSPKEFCETSDLCLIESPSNVV